jgi:hypothetical protein
MRPALATFALATLTIVAACASCDSSARVGELRQDVPVPGEPTPPVDPVDAGTPLPTWRRQAPLVPCTIYAMAEVRSDDLYIGCNGGRIYRFDGVKVRLAYEVEDTSVFSTLWVAPDGQVWAGAQASYKADAPTQLHHFDGVKWSPVGGASRRITSITGADTSGPWITTATQIFHLEGGALVPSFTATAGVFRACAFTAPDDGACVGTRGLAVTWNGTTWSPVTGAPWSASAEVFGVEGDSLAKSTTFFYGEPITHPNGSHACRIARSSGGAFTSYAASTPCFASSRIERKRTGTVYVNGRKLLLISTDESYGGGLVFDPSADTVEPLCGPALAFSTGLANTRAGGLYGLLATMVGVGGVHVALNAAAGSNLDFTELSVAPDGTAWARVEDQTACGSVSARLVRFESPAWAPVPGPQGALSGRGLAAVARDRLYTIDLGRDQLLTYTEGGWVDGPVLEQPWSLGATRRDDLWIGGTAENFGHYDGRTFTPTRAPARLRQVEQIVPVGDEVWMVQQGVTSGDTDEHVVHYASGVVTDSNLGIQFAGSQTRLGALDPSHVYASGAPAQVWDGTTWKPLTFDANGVWPRSPEEVYFIDGGDIWRWNGRTRERAYHGFIPIRAIGGAKDHGFAVGPGGLTIEFGVWPDEVR